MFWFVFCLFIFVWLLGCWLNANTAITSLFISFVTTCVIIIAERISARLLLRPGCILAICVRVGHEMIVSVVDVEQLKVRGRVVGFHWDRGGTTLAAREVLNSAYCRCVRGEPTYQGG